MSFTSFLALFCILNLNQFLTAKDLDPTLETYIVHVEAQSDDLDAWYDSFLPRAAVASNGDQPRILHRYRNVFPGFAAKLSADEVETMRQKKGFVSARPERVLPLHTTHSPRFLGLIQDVGVWKGSNYGKGIIIGLLDTGITPHHPSFGDEGMPAPPAKWKGKCEFSSRRACNNKLIGARSFDGGAPSDEVGHGTHTSGTAGGNFVSRASIFGNANGTAAGIAPLAHVAMYKVCSERGCAESDIVAGMDAAIGDGVDIISMSLGGLSSPFYSDAIAIGAYAAMDKGILVSCSAGNSGPTGGTTMNEAPWIMTVGASTINRKLRATVVLGNGEELDGETAYQPKHFSAIRNLEIVNPGGSTGQYSYCEQGDLDGVNVTGKIVLCEMGGFNTRIEKGETVKSAGGAAMILMNDELRGYTLLAEAHVLPVSHISYADSVKLGSYVNSVSKPTARIVFKGTLIGDGHAPVVAFFSGRGPSFASPGILKPDIIGPGVNIIAAWNAPLHNKTNKHANFNMISGTSMSCPHLSGVAALLKSSHPDWSPAAIKSAIMTTANPADLRGHPIDDEQLHPASVFATGAGHVHPSRAKNPGLIYDLQPDDYIPYLCGLNYTSEQVGLIVQRKVACSKKSSIPEAQLNYPSFSINLGSTPQTYKRTVTNVGKPSSSYNVAIVSPAGVTVKVRPTKLSFSNKGQKLSYSVTFSRSGAEVKDLYAQGLIKWTSARHSVSSPIAVAFA